MLCQYRKAGLDKKALAFVWANHADIGNHPMVGGNAELGTQGLAIALRVKAVDFHPRCGDVNPVTRGKAGFDQNLGDALGGDDNAVVAGTPNQLTQGTAANGVGDMPRAHPGTRRGGRCSCAGP